MNKRRIGILTSGGDCSGLNSVIRAAFLRAEMLGYDLIGIKRGAKGLIERPLNYFKLTKEMCDASLLTQSGSILLSNTKTMLRADGSKYTNDECTELAVSGYKELGLDGLIFIGGDGSLNIMNRLLAHSKELNIVAIPKTIDNDVSETDVAIGFTTAIEVVAASIENIRSTAMSHERVMVIEVMGRDAGFIAMYAGIAAGVDVILVPEFKYSSEKLIHYVKKCYDYGKNHCLIVVAEAVESDCFKHDKKEIDHENKISRTYYQGIGEHIVEQIKSQGFDARAVTLGHTQRGGKTAVQDRIIGSAFGMEAVNRIAVTKECGVMLAYKNGVITDIPISSIAQHINRKLGKDDICVKIAQNIGVYIGEI